MPKEKKTGAIILAAGNSSRLGSPKQLLQWKGKSLIRRAADMALTAGCMPVFVVLGAYQEDINNELTGLPIEVIINANWERGMGSSLQVGLQKMAPYPCEGILVMVCDQPFLSVKHLRKLIGTFYRNDFEAIASEYAETSGVPAIFSTQLLTSKSISSYTSGAKHLLKQIPQEKLGHIPFPKGAIDIDTEEDWHNLQ